MNIINPIYIGCALFLARSSFIFFSLPIKKKKKKKKKEIEKKRKKRKRGGRRRECY